MSAAGWFVTGWLSGAIFIALGIWIRWRWDLTSKALDLDYPNTSGFLTDYKPDVIEYKSLSRRASVRVPQ